MIKLTFWIPNENLDYLPNNHNRIYHADDKKNPEKKHTEQDNCLTKVDTGHQFYSSFIHIIENCLFYMNA